MQKQERNCTTLLELPTPKLATGVDRITPLHTETFHQKQYQQYHMQSNRTWITPWKAGQLTAKPTHWTTSDTTDNSCTDADGVETNVLWQVYPSMDNTMQQHPSPYQQHPLLCQNHHPYLASSNHNLDDKEQAPSPTKSHGGGLHATTSHSAINIL